MLEKWKQWDFLKKEDFEYNKKKKEFEKARNDYRNLHEKIRNMIDDLHYKSINKLMEYSIICIPKLNIFNILEKNELHKQAKRILQTEKHGLLIKKINRESRK